MADLLWFLGSFCDLGMWVASGLRLPTVGCCEREGEQHYDVIRYSRNQF